MGYILLALFIGFKILEGFVFVGLVGTIYGSILLQVLVGAGLVVETMIILHICIELQKLKEFVSACGAIGIFGTVDKTRNY